MSVYKILNEMRKKVNAAPRNGYIAELHLQVIKYAAELKDLTGKEFCEAMEIGPAFGTEFSKMRKISERLKKAGLDVTKI